MSRAGRSTDELFASPAMRRLVRELLDDFRTVLRELNARLDRASALLDRREHGDSDPALLVELDEHSAVIGILGDLREQLRTSLEPYFVEPLPVEWVALLRADTPEPERAAAAAEWASRIGLHTLLHRRYPAYGKTVEAGLRAAGMNLKDEIAQALRVAATEANAAQRSVLVEIDGERRRYVRGIEGATLIPSRDLPRAVLGKWIFGETRRYLVERWIPDWRDREQLDAHGVRVVSLEDLPASETSASPPDELAAEVARLEAQMSETELRLARLRAAGLSHGEIGAALGASPAAVRQRFSRLVRRLRLSHPSGRE